MRVYKVEDLATFERDEYGYLICPSGDYSQIKSFGKCCSFGERCNLDNNLKFENIEGNIDRVLKIERMGNAVCPPVATALVQANCRDIALKNAIKTMAELEQTLNNRKQKKYKQIKTKEIFDLVEKIARKYGVEVK